MIWIHTCLYNWITLDLCDIFQYCKTWICSFFFLACCCCFHLTFLATEQIDQTLETFHDLHRNRNLPFSLWFEVLKNLEFHFSFVFDFWPRDGAYITKGGGERGGYTPSKLEKSGKPPHRRFLRGGPNHPTGESSGGVVSYPKKIRAR